MSPAPNTTIREQLNPPHRRTSPSQIALRRLIRRGIAVSVLLCGGLGGWAGSAEISGAVIATGVVVVNNNVKKVQHPTGGVVGEINARDGDVVKAGALLVRLDETLVKANLAIVTRSLVDLQARKARLEAERDDRLAITFPEALVDAARMDTEVANVLDGERSMLKLRVSARTGQKTVLMERSAQLREEIAGHLAQAEGKADEIALIKRELVGAHDLWQKNLMPITKLTALEREAVRLGGERAQLLASVAKARGQISEIALQVLQIDRDMAGEVGKELRETEVRIGELIERKIAAEDQMRRIDIRAPVDGTVHQSTVHTVDGVVQAGETLMLIVPKRAVLVAEVKVAPQDIDHLRVGQPAVLRFAAFNQRTTPEINGTVEHVAADVTVDQRTGTSHYVVRIALPNDEVTRLGDVKLVPGMPVESFIKTGSRSVISYLIKPLTDQMTRAFRES